MDTTFLDNADLAGLKAHWETLSAEKQELAASLITEGQTALFADWDAPGTNDDAKTAFLDTLLKINGNYPGGLVGYINNARKLLAESKAGANPFEGLPGLLFLSRYLALVSWFLTNQVERRIPEAWLL